jgi:hypothetical protein
MSALSFQQWLFPSLRIGCTATVMLGRRKAVQLHCQQGAWDGACGLYCAAMALTLLGRLNGCTRLPGRRSGVTGALWRAGRDRYFDGIRGTELAELLREGDPSLFVRSASGAHRTLLKLTRAHLEAGRLAIVGWRSRNRRIDHWVLAIGLEGLQRRNRLRQTALLCLDPSVPAPVLCGYNARLELTGNPRSYGRAYVRFQSSQDDSMPVRLTELVVVGEKT